jgi:hypothetical protein
MRINTAELLKAASDGLSVADFIERMLADGTETVSTRPVVNARTTVAPMAYRATATAQRVGTATERSIRRGAAQRPYELIPATSKRHAAQMAAAVDGLVGQLADTYRAMRKARKPLTNDQLAALTGISPKSMESVVYRLRHAGLIQHTEGK